MSKFNQNIDYTDRLRENMQQIPFSIYQHLVEEDTVLRGRQKVAVKDMAESMFAGNRASLMWMPTGGGKTVMMARMLEGLHRDAETQRPKRTIFVSDSTEGVKNTVAKIKQFSGLDATPYYGKEKDLTGEVIVTTYNSWQGKNFPVDPLDIDLVVLDEGHKSLSPARRKKLAEYKNAIWMPLTATPTYDEERSLLEYYALGHQTSIPEAVDHGLISSFRNIVLNTGVEVNLDDVPLSASGEFNEKALEKEINKKGRNQAIGEFLLFGTHPDTGEPLRNLRGIVGCCNVVHTKRQADELNEMHKKFFPEEAKSFTFAAHIYGAMPDGEKEQIFADHRAGKIGYLTYADLLIHNYDDPTIQVTVNSRLTQSHVVIRQSHGRGLRIDQNNPHKIALCVDVIDDYVGDNKKKAPLVYGTSIGTTLEMTNEVEQAAKQKHAQTRFLANSEITDTNNNADIQAMLENTKLKVTVDQEEIFALIKDISGPEIPEKTENDLTRKDLIARGLKGTIIAKNFNKIKHDWQQYITNKEADIPDNQNSEPLIPYYQVDDKGDVSQAVPFDKFELFDQMVKGDRLNIPQKTEKDLMKKDLIDRGLTKDSIYRAFRKIKNDWEKYEANKAADTPDQQNPQPTISYYQVDDNGSLGQAVQLDQFELFEQIALGDRLGIPKKTSKDLTSIDLLARGLNQKQMINAFDKIKSDWENYEANKVADVPDEQNLQPEILYYQVDNNGKLAQAILLEQFELFERIASGDRLNMPQKTEHDLMHQDLRILGLTESYITKGFKEIKETWEKYEANKAANMPDEQNPKPAIPYYQVANNVGNSGQAVPRNQFELFERMTKGDRLNMLEKTARDLIYLDLMALGLNRPTIGQTFNKIKSACEQHRASQRADVPNEQNPEPKIKSYQVLVKNRPTIAIIDDQKEFFIQFAKNQIDVFGNPIVKSKKPKPT